jgi:hypothetical protein
MVLLAVLVIALGCGGGGGGGTGGTGGNTVEITGRVVNIVTTGAPNPQAQVQAGNTDARTLTNASDGSFVLTAPKGTTTLVVDTRNSSQGVFTFTIPAANEATDVGDLWVGPERVTVTGRVVNSTNDEPVANADVSLAGRTAKTNANGTFTLEQVAYAPGGFPSIVGSVRATGFFANSFDVLGRQATGGVVTLDNIPLVPSNDANPPGTPYNIFGRVSPSNLAPGTTVTLKQGGEVVRTSTVGADGRYYFWVPAGTYTISYRNGSSTAPDQTVILEQSNQVVQKDVTLS